MPPGFSAELSRLQLHDNVGKLATLNRGVTGAALYAQADSLGQGNDGTFGLLSLLAQTQPPRRGITGP